MRPLIETPRFTTAEPLVETNANGNYIPAGRRLATEDRTDGLSHYGLTQPEEVAFEVAADRLRGTPAQNYTDAEIDTAMAAAGMDSNTPVDQRNAFIAQYLLEHPAPTSFAPLPDGDPSSNYAAEPVELAQPVINDPPSAPPVVDPTSEPTPVVQAAPVITHVDELTPAVPAPSVEKDTHVIVENTHVGFLHRLLTDLESGVSGAERAFAAAFRRVFS